MLVSPSIANREGGQEKSVPSLSVHTDCHYLSTYSTNGYANVPFNNVHQWQQHNGAVFLNLKHEEEFQFDTWGFNQTTQRATQQYESTQLCANTAKIGRHTEPTNRH